MSVRTVGVALALVLALGLGIGWFIARGDAEGDQATTAEPAATTSAATTEAPAEPTTEPVLQAAVAWPAGTAAGLSCNLLDEPGFDDGVIPGNYFADPEVDELAAIVAGVGVDGSPALGVGSEGQYGLYGTIVAVESGVDYVFTASARIAGAADAAIGFTMLDADFAETGDSMRVVLDESGRAQVRTTMPEGAAYAVPFVFKEGTLSEFYVDELAMFRADDDCALFVEAAQG